jgi:hypothetical protein
MLGDARMSTLGWILVILLVLLAVGALPRWQYSSNWGNTPSTVLVVVLIVVLVLAIMGRL